MRLNNKAPTPIQKLKRKRKQNMNHGSNKLTKKKYIIMKIKEATLVQLSIQELQTIKNQAQMINNNTKNIKFNKKMTNKKKINQNQ